MFDDISLLGIWTAAADDSWLTGAPSIVTRSKTGENVQGPPSLRATMVHNRNFKYEPHSSMATWDRLIELNDSERAVVWSGKDSW